MNHCRDTLLSCIIFGSDPCFQGQDVAVKKLESMAIERGSIQDLLRQAEQMASCCHPNIAVVHGLMRDSVSGVVSIVMKFYSR